MLDFLFGRPLIKTIENYGLNVQHSGKKNQPHADFSAQKITSTVCRLERLPIISLQADALIISAIIVFRLSLRYVPAAS